MKQFTLYALLVCLWAFIRLDIGPWYHVSNPMSIKIVDGLPASWESTLFVNQYSSFWSSNHNIIYLTEIQLRAFIPISVASLLATVTHESYWSTTILELIGWLIAAKGTEHIALSLGVPERLSIAAGVLVSSSPLFISQMWMHVLHLIEFSSITFGLLLCIKYSQDIYLCSTSKSLTPKIILLTTKISATLFIMSHMYVYHALLAVVFCLHGIVTFCRVSSRGIQLAAVYIIATATSYGMFLLWDSIFVHYLSTSGVSITLTGTEIGGDPLKLLYSRLQFIDVGDSIDKLLLGILSIIYRTLKLITWSYHPGVMIISLIGVIYGNRDVRNLYGILTSLSLVASALYPAPWTAMTSYPLVYISCVITCDKVSRALGAIGGRYLPDRPRLVGVTYGIAFTGMIGWIMTITNLDVIGDDTFLRTWWRLYSASYPS